MSTTSTSLTAAVIAAASLALTACGGGGHSQGSAGNSGPTVHIVAPDAQFDGKSYPEWAAGFWKWSLELPAKNHPFTTCERDFSVGQSGTVWYWSAPNTCPNPIEAKIPDGKALLLPVRVIETSSLEAPPFRAAMEAQQRQNSKFFADHLVNVFATIDGKPVDNLKAFRFSTPQICCFHAPTPWIFGATGGDGTAVGDGYYLLLDQLSKGKHTIHYGGTFRFAAGEFGAAPTDIAQDITIDLEVTI
jgi:hypothetical protein